MVRKIGEILVEDFKWPRDTINTALAEQAQDGQRRQLGHYLKGRGPDDGHLLVALDVQSGERIGPVRSRFDTLEYTELGNLYRFEREDITKKVRAYAWVMSVLFLFAGYPLSAWLNASQQGGTVSEPWKALFVLYALMGCALTSLSVFLGDNLVSGYAVFLARRMRISLARAQLRASAIRAGATPTVMPHRGADDGPILKLSGLQRNLPISFCLWSTVKLGLYLYFVSCLLACSFAVSALNLISALWIMMAVLLPCWTYLVSKMCEKYHVLTREGELMLERGKPVTIRVPKVAWRVGEAQQWLQLYFTPLGLIAALCIYHWVRVASDLNAPVLYDWFLLGLGLDLTLLVFGLRVIEVRYRLESAKALPEKNPDTLGIWFGAFVPAIAACLAIVVYVILTLRGGEANMSWFAVCALIAVAILFREVMTIKSLRSSLDGWKRRAGTR